MTANFNGYSAREYFWGCTFTEKEPCVTWSFEEEEEDEDFLSHTLYLKQASLGMDAPKEEAHILQVETQDYEGNDKKIAFAHLSSAINPMAMLDLSFDHKTLVTFRLISGKGPVDLAATHLVEFPEEMPGDLTEEEDSDEDEEEDDEIETPAAKNGKAVKRKAKPMAGKKAKKGKRDDDDDDDEDEDDEEESDEDDDEEDMEDDDESEELESSPEVKRGKGKKAAPAKKGAAKKAVNGDSKKAVKTKAVGKKGKAK